MLIVSHFAPWWSPLREWIAAGRPWIEIEYGYWGLDTPRRATRRVTYCGHHNMHIHPRPYSRSQLFAEPAQQSWQPRSGEYVLVPMPVNEILMQRTGENTVEWCKRIEDQIKPYWSGPIVWRPKAGSKATRFQKFQQQLQQAHAVVGERTMACVEACLLGIPAYTVDDSITTLLMLGYCSFMALLDRQLRCVHGANFYIQRDIQFEFHYFRDMEHIQNTSIKLSGKSGQRRLSLS